jgi:hypothetical protein
MIEGSQRCTYMVGEGDAVRHCGEPSRVWYQLIRPDRAPEAEGHLCKRHMQRIDVTHLVAGGELRIGRVV